MAALNTGRLTETLRERCVRTADAARRAKRLYEDDCAARDLAIHEYHRQLEREGQESVRALGRVVGLSPSHVHRILVDQAAVEQRSGPPA